MMMMKHICLSAGTFVELLNKINLKQFKFEMNKGFEEIIIANKNLKSIIWDFF